MSALVPGKVGILAGSGSLPIAVAAEIVARGDPVHVVGIEGEAEAAIARFEHTWVKWGEIGHLLAALRTAGCAELVIIGGVSRPDLSRIRLDVGAVLNFPRLLSLLVGGDNSVLSTVVRFFEEKGLVVRGAHEVAPALVVGSGPLGRYKPSATDQKDIKLGFDVVGALGALDVGQAAVVTRGHVIAVEAAEGTDAMLQRAQELRQWGHRAGGKRMGVLVKRPKPRQEMRIDMPAIGPRTIELVAAAGLSGIAILAGSTLVAEREAVIVGANSARLFVVGVTSSG